MNIRRASGSDAVDFFRWWNDRETRRFSGSGCEVAWHEHLSWMCDNLKNPWWFVGEVIDDCGTRSVGAMRVDRTIYGRDDSMRAIQRNWVSIVLAPEERGKGYGTRMLKALPDYVRVSCFHARIHQLNTPSTRAFEKAGFVKSYEDPPWLIYLKNRE